MAIKANNPFHQFVLENKPKIAKIDATARIKNVISARPIVVKSEFANNSTNRAATDVKIKLILSDLSPLSCSILFLSFVCTYSSYIFSFIGKEA